MKTCKNCKYYTGILCHGHGEYWGECKKNKNTLHCDDDTPCLQDLKTIRQAYYEQKNKRESLEYQLIELQFYKLRYESRERTIKKYQDMLYIACKYIDPKKANKYKEEQIKFLQNYEIPKILQNTTNTKDK